jgi:hypothetical protein
MILKTAQGNPLPTAVVLSSDSDGLTLFSYDDDGTPVQSYFILTPAGGHNTNPKGVVFYGGKNSSMFNGTLDGFTSPTVVPLITVGPAFSTQYFPPDQSLIEGVVYATLIAVPVSGGPSRQLQITVQETNNKVF